MKKKEDIEANILRKDASVKSVQLDMRRTIEARKKILDEKRTLKKAKLSQQFEMEIQ